MDQQAIYEDKLDYPHNETCIRFERLESMSGLSYDIVYNTFKVRIEPVYGNQHSALKKIKEGIDRSCELMLNCDNPVGILVYKNELQNEYGFKNALELKTICLINPEKNSGKGWGTILWQRIEEIARQKSAQKTFCTCSSKVAESIICALKNGYLITDILKKNKNDILYLLAK